MCDTKWVLSNCKCHDMSEIQGRAVRKDDKYANENISETLSSRFPLAMGRLFFKFPFAELDTFLH